MYKKFEPIDVKVMLRKRYHGHNTICEKLREIYMLTDNDDIKMKCRIGMSMVKSMHEKLKWYKQQEILRHQETK